MIKGLGSFTGIRIGVATAKAFSDSLNIDLIGVSSLEALAYNSNTEYVCSILDAKNENCYIALFKKDENTYKNIISPFSASVNDALFIINQNYKNSNISFVGDGAQSFKSQIETCFPNAVFCENNLLDSYNLGIAGYYKYKENNMESPLPLYLRKPQAEINFKKKQ